MGSSVRLMYGADELPLMLDQSVFSIRMRNTVVLLLVTSVVVVVVNRPQPGEVGLVAALHAFPLAFFSCRHAFLQALSARRLGQADLHFLNSVAISCLQSLPHLAIERQSSSSPGEVALSVLPA